MRMRVGIGSDIHRLGSGRKLIIGGVMIPYDKGEIAHSDGDVLIHAIIDAILGAKAMGDIGTVFPDTAEETKDADSVGLLKEVISRAEARIINIDSTITLEQPKLRPHIDAIRKSLASSLGIPESAVSVKAKTAEGLGPIGEGLAIKAEAAVLID